MENSIEVSCEELRMKSKSKMAMLIKAIDSEKYETELKQVVIENKNIHIW